MNSYDFEAYIYILWFIIVGYFKLDTIYSCIYYITKNKNLSICCVFTYFIILSKSVWDYLFYFSLPIVFWSIIFEN